jgi:hypothetical protein
LLEMCFFNLSKNQRIGSLLGTIGDALMCGYTMLYQTRQCLLFLLLTVES